MSGWGIVVMQGDVLAGRAGAWTGICCVGVLAALTGCDLTLSSERVEQHAGPAQVVPAPSRMTGPGISRSTQEGPLGFHDVLRDGTPRPVRDDTGGQLPGMVQFAQSHTVDPSGNAARNMPDLVPSRNALLLFTPQQPQSGVLRVQVRIGGELRYERAMSPPHELPRSDFPPTFGRPEVVYSRRAWSVALPWQVVQPGMSLQFVDAAGRSGQLAANAIDMGAPAKLVLWGVRIGMLTDPPVEVGTQAMLERTATAATDYFQTLPIARLTVARYEDQRLTRVMLTDGSIVTGASAMAGDVYTGDLREVVGKSQYSIGINLANYGVSSSPNGEQRQPQITPQLVYHHSAGNYSNGRQVHGLSGGNAIATLYRSIGNEWSHELGHHYGMGHYPGTVGGNYFWAGHHADSGWGFIDHRRRFRSNLAFYSGERNGLRLDAAQTNAPEHFAGLYSYNADAMSGGRAETAPILSSFTHHTGYTARRIQAFVDRAWFDPASPTGYRRWDASQRTIVDVAPAGMARPSRLGVPVFTLLGAYDPLNRRAVIHPPAKGNYGIVFDGLPAPDPAASACWLAVRLGDGRSRTIGLPAVRIVSTASNKFHVNIAQADDPRSVALSCRIDGATTTLDEVVFPSRTPELPPAVVVGEEAGYEALAAVELSGLDAALRAMQSDPQPYPSLETGIWLDSWRDRIDALSAGARAVAQTLDRLDARGRDIDQWMSANAAALEAKEPQAVAALKARITGFGLIPGYGYASGFWPILGPAGCLAVSSVDNTAANAKLVVEPSASCTRTPRQRWLLDKRGALRNGAFPGHCVTLEDRRLALKPCHRDDSTQLWVWTAQSTLTSQHAPELSMDMVSSTRDVIAYPTHGGTNQRWTQVTRDPGALLVHLSADNARRLYGVLPMDRPPPSVSRPLPAILQAIRPGAQPSEWRPGSPFRQAARTGQVYCRDATHRH